MSILQSLDFRSFSSRRKLPSLPGPQVRRYLKIGASGITIIGEMFFDSQERHVCRIIRLESACKYWQSKSIICTFTLKLFPNMANMILFNKCDARATWKNYNILIWEWCIPVRAAVDFENVRSRWAHRQLSYLTTCGACVYESYRALRYRVWQSWRRSRSWSFELSMGRNSAAESGVESTEVSDTMFVLLVSTVRFWRDQFLDSV